jgi:precorrin-2 dehydrogenase/sirohydrochlorin ferrochelatase
VATQRNPHLYAAFLDLRGAPVLVVGGGAVAARKARALLKAGARVTAVAKRFDVQLQRTSGLRKLRRGFRRADLRGARLVFAATDDRQLNARIAARAEERGIWANVAAPPEAGRLVIPATLRRGRLCLAISTGGASAAAARGLRLEFARRLGAEWAAFLDLLEARRGCAQRAAPEAIRRRRLLRALGHPRWVKFIRRHGRRAAARAMDALIRAARVSKRLPPFVKGG